MNLYAFDENSTSGDAGFSRSGRGISLFNILERCQKAVVAFTSGLKGCKWSSAEGTIPNGWKLDHVTYWIQQAEVGD